MPLALQQRVEEVKRGVWQAGGFPLEVPAISLSEPFMKPTTMLYRNLLAMETEELLRAYPFDGAVLLGGCDKTTPALLMGAFSGPAVHLRARRPDAAARTGAARRSAAAPTCGSTGTSCGPGTSPTATGRRSRRHRPLARPLHDDGHRLHDDLRRRGAGPDAAGRRLDPGADSGHRGWPPPRGRRIVEMVWRTCGRRASSTARVRERGHRGPGARRLHQRGHPPDRHGAAAGRAARLDDFDRISRTAPVLANIRPSGKYLMEDFYYAGGLRALMRADRPAAHRRLDRQRPTLGRERGGRRGLRRRRHPPARNPLSPEGGLAVLRGNLAPDGAVIKHTAADAASAAAHRPRRRLRRPRRYRGRIDDPTSTSPRTPCWCCKNAGPLGGPACPSGGCCRSPRSC